MVTKEFVLLVSDSLDTPENQALRQALAELGEFQLVDESVLLPALEKEGCQLAILDASHLTSRSDELISAIKSINPHLPVALMTSAPHWKVAKAAIRAGAEYIEKSQDPKILRLHFAALLDELKARGIQDLPT